MAVTQTQTPPSGPTFLDQSIMRAKLFELTTRRWPETTYAWRAAVAQKALQRWIADQQQQDPPPDNNQE